MGLGSVHVGNALVSGLIPAIVESGSPQMQHRASLRNQDALGTGRPGPGRPKPVVLAKGRQGGGGGRGDPRT
jgi:hypothetical protein